MAITLRNNKGAALTYEELDINFHEYFYSASVSSNGKSLALHYTGSALKAENKVTIPLNTYTGSSEVAGNIGQFQYNLNGNDFAGAANLVYVNSNVGIGTSTPTERLHVAGGDVLLDASELFIAQGALSASFAYSGTTRDLSIRNHHVDNNSDIVFLAGGQERMRIKGDGTITQNGANANLGTNVLSGSIIFGKSHEDTHRTKLMTWDAANPRIENNNTHNLLRGNERGVILEGAQTAQVIVGLQSSTGNEGFNIISAPPTSSNEPTYNRLVAHFGADGNVGIGTSTTPSGYQFTVSGSISGSAGMYIAGNTVVSGSLTSRSNLFVDQATTLSGSLTVNTIDGASSATNYNFLVQDSNKVVKQVNAAPIPVGGIIMWSGAVNSLPAGWKLCDGQNGTPNLENKFIVASNNSTGTPTTTVSGSAVASGGSATHNHTGNTGNHTLTTSQIPSHSHPYKDSYYIEINNPGTGQSGAIGGVDYVGSGGTTFKGSGDSDNDNKYVYWRLGTSTSAGGGGQHLHTVSTDYNLPPYYALAYIMYTGS